MEKIRGVIDRFEGERAVIRAGGADIIIPKKELSDFKEGESITIIIATDAEETENNAKIAQELMTQIFKD